MAAFVFLHAGAHAEQGKGYPARSMVSTALEALAPNDSCQYRAEHAAQAGSDVVMWHPRCVLLKGGYR